MTSGELAELRARLDEAQGTLRAIRSGEVDAVIVADENGPRVYTLEGAEHAYRVLIESMNEGALTLSADKTILYANERFATMVQRPLEKVIGASFRRFLSVEDRPTLRRLLERADEAGCKLQVRLNAGAGSHLPVLISMRPLAESGPEGAAACMVVTDMTEARRNETTLRDLSHRLMKAQEIERGRVAVELHDNITQLLCAVILRSQSLADQLPPHPKELRDAAVKLREMLGRIAEEVERISRGLRPSVLNELGLVPVLRGTSAEFAARTGVPVKLTCMRWTGRLSSEGEVALYRVLQETLRNVETHANARHVTVRLTQKGTLVEMMVTDDGIGFDPHPRPAKRKARLGYGLLGMSERAAAVGGALSVKSAPGEGTTIKAEVPFGNRSQARKISAPKKRRAG